MIILFRATFILGNFSRSVSRGVGQETYARSTATAACRRLIELSIVLDKRNMTQQHLADRIGVTRQTVNAIEGGKYSPSLEVAFRIASVFERPLEEVFEYEDGHGGDPV